MTKTNFHLVLDGFGIDTEFAIAREKGFDCAVITIETDLDICLAINEQFFPIKFIENLSLYEFSKIISCDRSEITQDFFDSVCAIIYNNIFYVYSVEYNMSALKSVSRDLWFSLSKC